MTSQAPKPISHRRGPLCGIAGRAGAGPAPAAPPATPCRDPRGLGDRAVSFVRLLSCLE